MTSEKLWAAGGPAYPNITPDMNIQGAPGMTLRDWFAGQALAGLMGRSYDHERDTPGGMVVAMASDAFKLADAMLRERAK